MKKIISFSCIALAFASCTNDKPSTENKSTAQPINKEQLKSQAMTPQEIAQKLDGMWLSEEYLKSIDQKKSIYKSDYKSEILGFILEKSVLLSKNPEISGFNEHEGGNNCPLIFDEKSNKFINDVAKSSEFGELCKNPFELNLIGDKSLEMAFTQPNKVDRYRKVDKDIQTALRGLLMDGKYVNKNDNSEISFNKNGDVNNFKSYKYYELIFDFVEGLEMDAIIFYNSKSDQDYDANNLYHYEFKGNQLILQRIEENTETYEHKKVGEILTFEKK